MIDALEMSQPERRARHARLLKQVSQWSARDWLNAQMADLGIGVGD
jgi:trehalose-6-phosphate synthase